MTDSGSCLVVTWLNSWHGAAEGHESGDATVCTLAVLITWAGRGARYTLLFIAQYTFLNVSFSGHAQWLRRQRPSILDDLALPSTGLFCCDQSMHTDCPWFLDVWRPCRLLPGRPATLLYIHQYPSRLGIFRAGVFITLWWCSMVFELSFHDDGLI